MSIPRKTFLEMQERAEAAEKALAEYVEKMGYQFQETINRVMAERDDWCRTNEASLAKRDDLQAELEKMKSDRDQFADEADSLRARVREYDKALLTVHDVNMRHEARIAQLEEALRELLETTSHCNCEEAYTDRGLHTPDCYADEPAVAHARRVLEGK